MNMKKKRELVQYDFSKPIKLLEYHRPGFDIMFYSAILGIAVCLIVALVAVKDGKFALTFTLPRVLISLPLIIIAYIFKQLLQELRVYPKKLLEKNVWTIEELMALTKKDRKETENIMTHVLESCFIVDINNIKNK